MTLILEWYLMTLINTTQTSTIKCTYDQLNTTFYGIYDQIYDWNGICDLNNNTDSNEVQFIFLDSCPDGKHLFTNCTDPCFVADGSQTMCKSLPHAECRPEYCGGCIARFFDESGIEVHCEQGRNFDQLAISQLRNRYVVWNG